ncbi:MAG TPA: flagellar hook-associated protein FlgK [Nautiliaceae bacterium]|nr:flagellar hook-associated protein FlgK [Nautiliaceae bacterium]
MAISLGLHTAVSGLQSHKLALDVTSNNISNASNPDYVRERVVFSNNIGINTIPGTIGTGVSIEKIYRLKDTFLFNRYISTSANLSNFSTQEKYLKEISVYFPDVTDNGLYKDIENFFNAWQTFASNPNDGAVKVDLASKTQILSDNIKTLRGKLLNIQQGINEEINTKIKETNTIIKEIASLNKEIYSIEAGDLKNANELRDKRDALEKRLKELMDAQVYKNGEISVNVQGENTIGYEKNYSISIGGYTILDNSSFKELTISSIDQNISIGIKQKDLKIVDITKSIKNGEIGGLISIRGNEFNKNGEPINGAIGEVLNNLDALASGIIRSVNSLYAYAAQESVETDTISSPNTIPSNLTNISLNTLYNQYQILNSPIRNGNIIFTYYDDQGNFRKSIEISISTTDSISDIIDKINNKLDSENVDDIEAKLINGQLKFVDNNNKESSKLLVKDDGALLFNALNQIEYMPLDKINYIKLPLPLQNGNFDLVVYNNKGEEVAKRTITIDIDSKNPRYSTIAGILAQINSPNIDDNVDNNLNNDLDDYYQAEFINGKFILSKQKDEAIFIGLDNDTADFGGSFGINKFFDGKNALDIRLKQEFVDDPSLIRASKTPNSGDNTVANEILQLQFKEINFYVNNKITSSTISGFYREMTTYIATKTQTTSDKKDAFETILVSIEKEYYSLSGVNLDEELINLEKFQRGYQANAKVVSTINEMLDALLNMKQ